ncbi:MAG: ImmA/IrrE family metallo-endopeptidase [bacterium]
MSVENNPINYLRSKLEKPSDVLSNEKTKEVLSRLSTSLGKIEYKDDDTVEISNENFKLSFSYSSLNKYSSFKNSKDCEQLNRKDKELLQNILYEPRHFRKLENLTLQTGDSLLELKKLYPENFEVFFSPDSFIKSYLLKKYPEKHISVDEPSFLGFAQDGKYKIVTLDGDMSRLGNLLTILHEIGHFISHDDPEYRKNKEQQNKNTEEWLAAKLKDERDAHAFMLKKIKPFLKPLGIKFEDVEYFIHNIALKWHSDNIRDVITFPRTPGNADF